MHEMGIAEQLVKIALDAIPKDIQNPRVENRKAGLGGGTQPHLLF